MRKLKMVGKELHMEHYGNLTIRFYCKNPHKSSSQSGVYTVGLRFDSPVSEQQRVALRLKTQTASVDLFIT